MPAIDEGWGMPSRQRKERLEEWRSTGIGAGLQGGEIYARRGSAGGVELTNDLATPTASASATPMPQGGMRQNVPAIAANMPDDLPLAIEAPCRDTADLPALERARRGQRALAALLDAGGA